MANKVIGRVLKIFDTNEIKSKKSDSVFYKREIVLDCTKYDVFTGERGYENLVSLEFVGDKCSLPNSFKPGQIVSVSFELQGSKFTDKDGNEKYFTRARAYAIETVEVKSPNQQAASAEHVNEESGLPF